MKIAIYLGILALTTTAIAQTAAPPTLYAMRSIDPASERFANVLDQVRAQYTSTGARDLIIVQHLTGTTLYIARLPVEADAFSAEVSALTGGRSDLTRTLTPDTFIVLDHPGPALTDGATLRLPIKQAGSHQYLAATGGTNTLPLYRADDGTDMSAERFIERLKSGETFTIQVKPEGQRAARYKIMW